MNLVDRAKKILMQPKQEWPVIEAESIDTKTLYTTYIMILAAIPAVASLISMTLIGGMFGRVGIGFALAGAIVGYIMSLIMVFVIAFIADALAPSFDGQKNMAQALKLTAFSLTASWVAGIFNIIPFLGWLLSLLGSLYGLYLFYLGAPVLMKVPEQKAIGYTVVIIVVAIVIGLVISMINAAVVGMGVMGAGLASGLRTH
jgi:Yip1 domain